MGDIEAKPDRELTPRQKLWLGHVQAWQQSGGSMKDYASAHGLPVREFYQWKRWLSSQGLLSASDAKPGKPRFQQVAVIREELPTCRITLRNGVRVEFSGLPTPTTLTALLTAAGAVS